MTSEELLQKLEQGDLAPPEVVASLRRQVAAAKQPIAPSAITKLLVDKGHLTAGQAQRLLDAGGAATASTIQKVAAAPAKPLAAKPASPSSSSLDDLGLAPLDDLPELAAPPAKLGAPVPTNKAAATTAKPASSAPKVTPLALDDLGLAPLEDVAPPPSATPSTAPAPKSPPKEATPKPPSKPAAPATKAPAPAAKPAPVATAPTALEDLTTLDDLGSGGLDSLDGLTSVDPLGSVDLSTAGGFDPLGGPADLATVNSPLATPSPPQATASTVAAKAAAASAVESRQTTWVAVGIGSVATLVLIVGLAIFLWPRGSGAVEFAAAEQTYQEKNYAAAIEKYDQLLRSFPRHEQASLVKVHRSMAAIHVAHTSQPADLLPILQREVRTLAPESAVTQIHSELAPLLLQLTEQLATQATQSKSADEARSALKSAQAALALCNDARLLPANLRPWQKLAEIEENLQLVARVEQTTAALERAKQSITSQLNSGNIPGALATGNELLLSHPEVTSEQLWKEFALPLSEAAVKGVKSATEKGASLTTPAKNLVSAAIPWQHLIAQPVAIQPGPSMFVVATGTVYALDEATGNLRWSRYLGCGQQFVPVQSVDRKGVCLVDVANCELLQLESATGRLVWRQPLPAEPIDSCVLMDGNVFVALKKGWLQSFDFVTGDAVAQAELSLPVRIGVQASADGKQLLQVADEGLVYLFSAADLKCQRVHFLGHSAGSIPAAIPFRDRWLVCENVGPNQSELHLLSFLGSTTEAKRQTFDEAVVASPVLLGERILLATSRGKVLVLEEASDESQPFKIASTVNAPSEEPPIRYLLPIVGGVLSADQGVTLLKFDAQRQLQPAWSAVAGASFDAIPQLMGQSVLTVHHDAYQGITWATSVNVADGLARWQVPLTMPLSLIAVKQATRPIVVPWQNVPASPSAALSTAIVPVARLDCVPLDSDQWLLTTLGKSELSLFDKQDVTALRSIKLPTNLAGPPALCGKQLLVPLADGSVASLNPQTGVLTAAPLIVPINRSPSALPATVQSLNETGTEVLVFNGSNFLATFMFAAQPSPGWTEVSSSLIPEVLSLPPIAAGASVFAYDRSGNLRSYSLPDLAPGQVSNSSGRRVTFGPHVVPEGVLLATSYDELLCLQNDGSRRWSQPLSRGKFIGKPIVQESNLVLVTQSGTIEVRVLATGELVHRVDCGQPVQGMPLVIDKTAWLTSLGGQILSVPLSGEQPQP